MSSCHSHHSEAAIRGSLRDSDTALLVSISREGRITSAICLKFQRFSSLLRRFRQPDVTVGPQRGMAESMETLPSFRTPTRHVSEQPDNS